MGPWKVHFGEWADFAKNASFVDDPVLNLVPILKHTNIYLNTVEVGR